MTFKNPQRRVLLAVTGLSPQVVTETIYALAQQDPPAVPNEVHLITTSEGAERARLSLLSSDPGWFHRLCADWKLEGIQFSVDNIHVLRGIDGSPLVDIRSPEDNERAADFITEKVRALTSDPTTALHVSIAGGRKTLGYYAGYALSLFGRPQDCLSHVLVSEPFESTWDFFYPTPESRVIKTRDDKLADTSDARVTLAAIPFVSLRDGLPKRLVDGSARFSQTVDAARRVLEPPELVIDLEQKCVLASSELVSMPAADLAFYALAARFRQEGHGALNRHDPNLAEPFLKEYRAIAGDMSGDLERAGEALKRGMDPDYFDNRKTRTKAALEQHLGPQLAKLYLIQSEGPRSGRFSLHLDPESIHFGRVEAAEH